MPRVTFNRAGELEDTSLYEASIATAITTKVKQRNAIKKELENPGEQVFHRKSERRRVARDIFLVFEEEPARRRGGARGSNKKKAPAKSKFGHLKVEEPKSKGLLRDIKNEPKCYLNTPTPMPICTNTAKNCQQPPIAIASQLTGVHNGSAAVQCGDDAPAARVNPIFLWVKQDDTRIVEVRCEDYDKRNRIRLTKTTNGWRAIPRTDPTSSRIVKFLQTPLLKVKREVYENLQLQQQLIQQKTNEMTAADLENEALCAEACSEPVIESNVEYTLAEPAPKAPKTLKRRKKKGKKVKTKPKKNVIPCNRSKQEIVEEALPEEAECEEPPGPVAEAAIPIAETMEYADNLELLPDLISNENDKSHDVDDVDVSETYQAPTPEFQLCPKTGLFLPPHSVEGSCTENSFSSIHSALPKDILVDLANCDLRDVHVNLAENLDADTKNLKDLLDDADLLQHCGGDNINSGAELIDSLVKRSCENNLIQETEILKEAIDLNAFTTPENAASHDAPNALVQKDIVGSELTVTGIINDVGSDSPKCLSFNEAGEIEGLNGELFQSTGYLETFDKDELENMQLPPVKDTTPITQSPRVEENISTIPNVTEETPKDLSYKKREEVCPPPESRSQCAVTSSSDVIKSPNQTDELPEIESTSEAIKNLILEQFIKLNALNTLNTPTAAAKPHQMEPIDLGRHSNESATNELAANHAPVPTTNYIETVVIDDNSDDGEPVKKRLRNAGKPVAGSVVIEEAPPTAPSTLVLDKDPDPLTQLQLLIRNTQWKVPDPILVPKDRLSAVLASPAREIPLLITTRPELRLPEAFAYPEIIQNPNILVISMAQLEAILKNEMELKLGAAKNKSPAIIRPVVECQAAAAVDVSTRKLSQPVNAVQHAEIHTEPKTLQSPQSKELNTKCSHVEGSLASDINAATLAVLNQMLWLPYFGQMSQEFLKSLKDPMQGIQSKYANLLPMYNHQFGLQQLDELYKNYMKQMTTLKQLNEQSANHVAPNFPGAMGAFQNPLEMAIFQKLVQNQMHNFLTMNPLNAADEQLNKTSASIAKQASSENTHSLSASANKTAETFAASNQNVPASVDQTSKSICVKNQFKLNCDNLLANAADNAEFNKFACGQKQPIESKPRLTCKSLSNLLEPESLNAAAIPLINLTHDGVGKPLESKSKESNCMQTEMPTLRTTRSSSKANAVAANATHHDMSKQRKRNSNCTETAVATGATAAEVQSRSVEAMNLDANPALWHPLFGSNAKTAYSSPWQWTTVTATGE